MNAKKINNNFEPYKRVVKFAGSAIIVLLELAAYYYVWMNYYNRNMTVAFWRRGNWLIAGEYLIRMEETRSGFAPLCNHFSKNAMEERITAIMKTRKITVISLLLAAALVVGTVTVFATSANLEANMNDVETEVDSVSLMSYVDPDDGKTYYSFDEGTTFEPLTDEEFEARFPTPNVQWWTYDEYKAWLADEKEQKQNHLGETDRVNGHKFTWTQEEIDKTIAMYEDVLADIKRGVMYSRSVDGQDQLIMSYDPADISTSTDTEVTRP